MPDPELCLALIITMVDFWHAVKILFPISTIALFFSFLYFTSQHEPSFKATLFLFMSGVTFFFCLVALLIHAFAN